MRHGRLVGLGSERTSFAAQYPISGHTTHCLDAATAARIPAIRRIRKIRQ